MNKGHTKSYKVILFDNSISVQTLFKDEENGALKKLIVSSYRMSLILLVFGAFSLI